MTFTLELPGGPLAEAIMRTVTASENASLANHSVRSFLFARIVAEREGVRDDAAYDAGLLFAATVLHDLGAGDLAAGADRFEVEGADIAAALLTEHGVPAPDVDRVWEAIALHTSPGIAERRGPIAYLTRTGIGIDFGRRTEVAAPWAAEIHAAYPRLAIARTLVDAVVERAARSPSAGPRYTFGGELLRERRTAEVTDFERGAAASPWGE